jgi:Domain of unknown function (DUF4832)
MRDDRRTGTYQYGGSSGPWVYMNEEGKYVPQVGFPDPDCRDGRSTVQEMRSAMFASNWDLFGSARHEILGQPADDPQELELIKQMGYRLRLVTARMPTTASRGSEIRVAMEMANDGSGSLFNPGGIELILRHRASGAIVNLADRTGWQRQPQPLSVAADEPHDHHRRYARCRDCPPVPTTCCSICPMWRRRCATGRHTACGWPIVTPGKQEPATTGCSPRWRSADTGLQSRGKWRVSTPRCP